MSTALNKTTGQVLKSVNTPDFENDDNYIINPTEEDISNNPPPEQTVADCLINALISLSTTTTEKIHSGVVTYNGANYTTTEYCFLNFDQRLNAINLERSNSFIPRPVLQ